VRGPVKREDVVVVSSHRQAREFTTGNLQVRYSRKLLLQERLLDVPSDADLLLQSAAVSRSTLHQSRAFVPGC